MAETTLVLSALGNNGSHPIFVFYQLFNADYEFKKQDIAG